MNCILLIDNNKKRLPNTQKPFLLIYKVIFIKVRDVDYKSPLSCGEGPGVRFYSVKIYV